VLAGRSPLPVGNGTLLYGSTGTPALLYNVRLTSNPLPSSVLGTLSLAAGEGPAVFAASDGTARGYFGLGTTPGRLVTIDLTSSTTPAKIGSTFALSAGQGPVTCGVLDVANGLLYVGLGTATGSIVQITTSPSLSANDALVLSAAVAGSSGDVGALATAAIDIASSVAYFATAPTAAGAQMVVVRLSLAAASASVGASGGAAGFSTLTSSNGGLATLTLLAGDGASTAMLVYSGYLLIAGAVNSAFASANGLPQFSLARISSSPALARVDSVGLVDVSGIADGAVGHIAAGPAGLD
jgi:hypothetical protein